jgi:hypothetical protein
VSQDEAGLGERTPSDPEGFVPQAGIIFAATVRQLGAATIERIPAERTAVVRVDSPLHVPQLLEAYVGRDVTVELRAPGELRVDDEVVFFANGWIYGESIALRELAHWPIRGDLGGVRRKVAEARERLADEEVRRRLADAAAVVAGRVAATAAVVPRNGREAKREHDPRWVEAVIAVDSVLRGPAVEKSLLVLFAGSRDVAWRNAPKLHVGQSGVWILHEETIKELGREALVLVDPRDSWPPERLGRIQALLNEID